VTCWRCGRVGKHAAWCSMPGGCTHCGWSPCRWWCLGEDNRPMLGLYRYGVTGLHETVRELTGSPA
jgi:hypothetical protein